MENSLSFVTTEFPSWLTDHDQVSSRQANLIGVEETLALETSHCAFQGAVEHAQGACISGLDLPSANATAWLQAGQSQLQVCKRGWAGPGGSEGGARQERGRGQTGARAGLALSRRPRWAGLAGGAWPRAGRDHTCAHLLAEERARARGASCRNPGLLPAAPPPPQPRFPVTFPAGSEVFPPPRRREPGRRRPTGLPLEAPARRVHAGTVAAGPAAVTRGRPRVMPAKGDR